MSMSDTITATYPTEPEELTYRGVPYRVWANAPCFWMGILDGATDAQFSCVSREAVVSAAGRRIDDYLQHLEDDGEPLPSPATPVAGKQTHACGCPAKYGGSCFCKETTEDGAIA